MNEKMIWDYLYQNTGNAIGAAAIMGNLMAESSLNPQCATGKNRTANYAKDADNGAVDFVNDGVAFGLVVGLRQICKLYLSVQDVSTETVVRHEEQLDGKRSVLRGSWSLCRQKIGIRHVYKD